MLVAIALATSACGGGHRSGAKVFASECAGCHSLTGREHGAMGGDLAIPSLRVADLESFAGTMPTPHRLSKHDVHAVAVFVRDREQALRAR